MNKFISFPQIQQLKELQAERDRLSIKDASCSTNVNEDGESLQELLQGVREVRQSENDRFMFSIRILQETAEAEC